MSSVSVKLFMHISLCFKTGDLSDYENECSAHTTVFNNIEKNILRLYILSIISCLSKARHLSL